MLPSFRLFAATFLCGFVVVFAGLRVAASLNDIHESLPMLTVHAATLSVAGARDARGAPIAVPMLYDLRFATSTATIAPMPAKFDPHAIDRAAPVDSLAVEDIAKPPRPAADATNAEAAPTKHEDEFVAAIKPEAPVSPEPAEPRSAATAPPAPSKPEQPQPAAVAAVDPLTPSPEASAPAAVELPAAPSVETAPVEPPTTPAAEQAPAKPQATSSAAETATVEPAAALAAESATAIPEPAPAANDAAVESSAMRSPNAGAAEPPATGSVDMTVDNPDPSAPAAADVPLPRPPAARPALQAKGKLVRSKRTAARDVFSDPFGDWPK